jgi:hypothetical protein
MKFHAMNTVKVKAMNVCATDLESREHNSLQISVVRWYMLDQIISA